METHKLREVFKPNMSEVAVYFYQLEKLIEVCSPTSAGPHASVRPHVLQVAELLAVTDEAVALLELWPVMTGLENATATCTARVCWAVHPLLSHTV